MLKLRNIQQVSFLVGFFLLLTLGATAGSALTTQANGTVVLGKTQYLPVAMKAYPLLTPEEGVRINWLVAQPVRDEFETWSIVRVQVHNVTTQTVAVEWPDCSAGTLRMSLTASPDTLIAVSPVILPKCTLYAGETLLVDLRADATGLTPGDYGTEIVFSTTVDETELEIDRRPLTFSVVPRTEHIAVQQTGVPSMLFGLTFIDEDTGWVVGADRTIVHTTDGGATWTTQLSGSGQLRDVTFVDGQHGWAVGTDGAEHGIVLKTDDGGATWEQAEQTYGRSLFTVQFVDEFRGWVLGSEGDVVNLHMWKTDDGGATWTSVPIESPMFDGFVLFDSSLIDRTHAWLLVWYNTRLLATADAGETWAHRPAPEDALNLKSAEFTSVVDGWVGGDTTPFVSMDTPYGGLGMIYRTYDGGQTWLPRALLDHIAVDSIYMLDDENGLFRGRDYVLFTDDGFQSWTEWSDVVWWDRAYINFGRAAQMVTPDVTYFIGENGTILKYARD